MSAPGMLVEYYQSKRLICALCLKTDNKDNLFVRTEENREDKIAKSKVVLQSQAPLQASQAPEQIVAWLKQAGQARDQQAAAVALEELWELLTDDQEAMNLVTLAGLYFPGQPSPEQISALYRALAADRLWFVRKNTDYLPRSRELVEETQVRIKAEAEKAGEREHVVAWLKKLWNSGESVPPEGYEKACQRHLTWIRDVAIFGADAARHKDVMALFKQLEIGGKDAPFRLMVKSGQWTEDEFVTFHRFHPPTDFGPELRAAAEESADTLMLGFENRLDLTHLEAVTIDDEDTTEIDDALSLEELPDGGFRVGIHIADASYFILPGSLLDGEALERGTDIYLPEGKTCIFPEVLSEDKMSLVAAQERLAFSYLVDFDSELKQVASQMAVSKIRVRERLTYHQADVHFAEPTSRNWTRLLPICHSLRQARQEAGAVNLPFPRTTVKVRYEGGEPQIYVNAERPDADSQLVVSETMILANSLSAQALSAAGLSAIFRSQEPPDVKIPADVDTSPASLFKLRRHFKRGSVGLEPARHASLGLDAYLQATSPIRRYSDLVAQRQLKSVLAAAPPAYTKAELSHILALVERNAHQAETMERERRQYWTLRFLEQKRFSEMDAVVLANFPDKHIIQIVPVLYECDCPQIPGHPLPPGTRLKVRIEVVFPREQTVRVTPVLDDDED